MSSIVRCFKGSRVALLLAIICLSCSEDAAAPRAAPADRSAASHLSVSKISLHEPNTLEKYRMITFDLDWENNYRTSSSADNWDAVWVFVKYMAGDGDWKHATLSTVSAEHHSPPGSSISAPSDGKGVFVRQSDIEAEDFHAPGVSLRWNYGLDDVADDAALRVKVFGLEMVHIPEGGFFAGDGQSDASLTKGSNDFRPWHITSEDAIVVTNTASNGYYYRSSKDVWNDVWNAHEDVTGASFTIPADYPKGYRAIYCMKYEMTERQYVDFLNTTTGAQASNRYDGANFNKFGYTISRRNDVYSTANPDRACGFINPADAFAFADWSALRPMTELEFEKICRGSGNPYVPGEYAWGTTKCINAVEATGTESDRQYMTESGANSYFLEDDFMPQFPLNVGIFTAPGKTREQCGAAYHGVMEMSTNLSETCVSIGDMNGRAFTYRNGDGRLSTDGYADESNWPLRDGKGSGYRGGTLAQEKGHMCVSVRVEATVAIAADHRHIPWGFRGVRTVSF